MELDLSGKVALVTGSSRGIGLAIAMRLYQEGCKLVLNGRDGLALAAVEKSMPGSIGFAADVCDPEQAKALISSVIDRYHQLDILVCNVGSGRSVAPGEESLPEWQRMFALNLWSATNCVEAARNALIERKGVIICISSICGREAISGAPVTYSAAKAALHAYVRGVARPLGKQGVRINAIAPGNILFDGSVWSRKLAEDSLAVKTMLENEVALQRLGSPQEIADVVAFLASPQASFATGTVWTLDGGQLRS